MSSSPGSLVLASRCAAKRMNFCLFMASSRALIDFCRPTNSGTTICGKTMMSRSGSNGTRNTAPPVSRLSFLSFSFRNNINPPLARAAGSRRFRRFLIEHDRLISLGDHFLGDQDLFDVRLRRDLVHHIQHRVLEDGPKPPGT